MRLTFLVVGLCASLSATAAAAESTVQLSSTVFVERTNPGRGGQSRFIEPASRLAQGERVVMVLNWQTPDHGSRFTVTTPVPAALAYEKSSSGLEEISTDGGRTWGRLGILHLQDRWGTRLASPQDATHVRWQVEGRGGQGRITYSAFVR